MKVATVLALGVIACGGAIDPNDDGGPANDGANDTLEAQYLACMNSSGLLDSSLKTCQSDNDCVIEQEQTDCCGTILYVGVNVSSVSAFNACETAWVDHFPGCGCDSGQMKTEDGMVTHPGQDGGIPAVHCTDFTSSGGVCMTYSP
jgi:hypothetical protein